MADNLSKSDRTRAMKAVRSIDTSPELRLRKALFAKGYRYRVHCKGLPGKPDIVFPSRRKAIFVHGCFWHGHKCKRGARIPKTNGEYWKTKIEQNVARDLKNQLELSARGWAFLVTWECSLKNFVHEISMIEEFING